MAISKEVANKIVIAAKEDNGEVLKNTLSSEITSGNITKDDANKIINHLKADNGTEFRNTLQGLIGTGMSSSDSTEIKKISSVNKKGDDVTDYQDASNAEQELMKYAEGELAQIQDPVQKSLAQQQFNLAIKQHTDVKNDIKSRVPDIDFKVAATSDEPDVLINAYAKQQGLSTEDATLKFAASPAQLKASLRGANDMQYAGAHIKDAFTGPLRILKSGGTTLPAQFNEKPLNLSDVGKNMSDSRGFLGSIANDPTVIPSMFIPGVGEAKLLAALGQGAIKGIAPEIAKQALDMSTGEQKLKDIKLQDLLISGGLGGLGGSIGRLRSANQVDAGKNILGAEDAKLNDLISGFGEETTRKKITNAQSKAAVNMITPDTDKDKIVSNLLQDIESARTNHGLSYDDYNKFKKSAAELKDRLSTIKSYDPEGIQKEYKEWLSKNAQTATKPKMLMLNHLMDNLNRTPADVEAAKKSMKFTPYTEDAQKLFNLEYAGKKEPTIGRSILQSAWAQRSESPLGYKLSDMLMSGSEKAAIVSPINSSNNKPYKPKDTYKEQQSLSDLIKGKKMNTQLAFVPKQQFLDENGNPYSSGRVQYFDATTSAPKAVYSDRAGTVPHTEVLLDAGGSPIFGGLWYGEGVYKVVVQKLISQVGPTYQTVYTVDNVDGAAVPVVGAQRVLFIEAVVNLPAVDSSLYDIVFCAGYYSVGDGGGGQFVWNGTTAAPADGGIVIKPTSLPAIGAWLRNVPAGEIPAAYWGYLSLLTAQAMESRLVAAHTFCSNYERVLLLQCGKTAIGHASSVTLTGGFIHIEAGYHIQRMASAPAMVTFTLQDVDLTIDGKQTLTKDNVTANVIINSQLPVIYSEWWGADRYGSTDSYTAIYSANITSIYGGGVEIAFDGNYLISAAGSPVAQTLDLQNISVTTGTILDNRIGSIILHKVTAPQIISEVFTSPSSDFSNWDCSNCEKTYAEWFLQGAPVDFQVINMCKTVTRGDTIKGTIYWNYGGTWVLPDIADDLSCSLVTQIPESTKWMDNGTTMQMANGVIYPEYWLNNNIQAAINMSGRNGSWIDGRDNRYSLSTNLTTAETVQLVNMKNITINGLITFDILGFGIMLKSCSFYAVTITSSAYAYDVNIQDCSFLGVGGGGTNWGVAANRLILKGCTIQSVDYLNTLVDTSAIITGNIFRDIFKQTTHNGVGDGAVIIKGNIYQNLSGDGENPDGSLLPPYAIVLSQPSNLNFSDNNINLLYPEYHTGSIEQSIILINGNVSNTWIANKLIVKNNSIDNESGAYTIAQTWGIRVQGFANYGHMADISENLATRIGVSYHMDTTKATGFELLNVPTDVFGPITFGSMVTVALPNKDYIVDFSLNLIRINGRYGVNYENNPGPTFTALGGGKTQIQFHTVVTADIYPLTIEHRTSVNVSGYIGAYN